MIATADVVQQTVEAIYRSESRRVFATLIRLLGDSTWPRRHCTMLSPRRSSSGRDGVPANPRAWLVSAGASRRSMPCAAAPASMPRWPNRRPIDAEASDDARGDDEDVEDDGCG